MTDILYLAVYTATLLGGGGTANAQEYQMLLRTSNFQNEVLTKLRVYLTSMVMKSFLFVLKVLYRMKLRSCFHCYLERQ